MNTCNLILHVSFPIEQSLSLPLHHPTPTRRVRLRLDPLLVSLHIPRKWLHMPIIAHPQARADILQHRHIVTHHQHPARELPQRLAQRIHGLDVQMIARLVQHEDMRVRQTQARERDAGFLAPRQQIHLLQRGGPRDAERAQVAPVLLIRFARVRARHEGDGARVHIQRVDVVLREETDAEAWVLRDEALAGFQLADEEFEHGGLPRAVGPHDADAGVELDVQVDVGEERVFVLGVPERDPGHLDDGRAQLLDVGEAEVDLVFGLGGLEDGHLLELLDAGLGFGGFGGVVAELVDEGLEVLALDHLVLVLAFGRLAALFLGGVEGVEVGAFVVVEPLAVLVDDVGGYFVEEGTVMGDH